MANKICVAAAVLGLSTTMAAAADLPSRVVAPAYVPPPVAGYSWTGIEFGLTTSYAFDNFRSVTNTGNNANTAAVIAAGYVPSVVPFNKAGFDDIGGGIGVNYQFTPGSGVVIGAMANFSYFNLSKNAIFNIASPFGPIQSNFHERLGYLGTVNGRIGYAFDRVLIYGTGGFAFGEMHEGSNFFQNGVLTQTGTFNGMQTGYDFGGGIEYAIPPDSILNYLSVEKLLGLDKTLGLNMFEGTIRGEFIHYDLGSRNVLAGPTANGAGSITSTYRAEGNVIRVGLGYKYSGAAPVVARY